MNYDLCSGTCLKKSGIYSVAMFHTMQIRTRFLKARSDFFAAYFGFRGPACGGKRAFLGQRWLRGQAMHGRMKKMPARPGEKGARDGTQQAATGLFLAAAAAP